jgi:mitogen-activated protein kinase kinase
LNFGGKAVVHAQGVDFSSGHSYKIAMPELQLLEELGRGAFRRQYVMAGQYGVVNKVHHIPTGVTMAMKVRFVCVRWW